MFASTELRGNHFRNHDVSPTLLGRLRTISERCTECRSCVKECAFLKRYGTPKEIANSFDSIKASSSICSSILSRQWRGK